MTRSILVTGATGNQGGAVARALLEQGHRVRAVTRNPDGDAAQQLKSLGAEVVGADFEDSASVRRAAAGLDTAFVMSTPFGTHAETERDQGIRIPDALDATDIEHIVYSSVASALDDTGIPHFESKAAVERHLGTLETPHAVVAPTAFLENADAPWTRPALAEGRLQFGIPADVPLQQVAVADLASFAALALTHPDRFAGLRVEVASVETTGRHLAAVLSSTTGRPVEYVEIPVDAIRESGGEDLALMHEFFRDRGYSVDIETLHATYPEVGWHSLEAWAREHDWSALERA